MKNIKNYFWMKQRWHLKIPVSENRFLETDAKNDRFVNSRFQRLKMDLQRQTFLYDGWPLLIDDYRRRHLYLVKKDDTYLCKRFLEASICQEVAWSFTETVSRCARLY